MFIDNNGKIKEQQDLSQTEQKIAYNVFKYAIVDAYNGGTLKAEFLKKNIHNIASQANMKTTEVQEVVNALFSAAMGLAFTKDRNEAGFKPRNK